MIGINASPGSSPSARTAAIVNNETYLHPRVFNNQRIGMMTYGNTSFLAPESRRREVQWIYSQTAPGVLTGDFFYYSTEHDLTSGQARAIDTGTVAVHLVACELGPNPASSSVLAGEISGATFRVIRDAGYLPMTDDYPRFRTVMAPLLIDEAHRLSAGA